MSDPVGWERHREGVERLVRSYDAIPRGAPVRLRTTTSNLFRPRVQAEERLDASGLTGVVAVDPDARTADVQGMCTYEDLVDVTLAHGLMPLVVPQLRTITLGGAVSGLGIEATSFRSGLPHESVREMDVLTGAGEVVTTRPGEELFDTFPNTYGSLGYATRLRIDLEPAPAYVGLRHVRFDDAALLAKTVAEIEALGSFDGERVDALDGVAFEPGHLVLTLATWRDTGGPTSDYTRQQVYYRSVAERDTDLLTGRDYLWRWDTDWFWCSRAFGAQHPRRAAGVAAAVAPLRRLPAAARPRPPLLRRRPARPAGRPAAARARGAGRRGAAGPAARVPRVVRRAGRHAAGVVVPGPRHPDLADLPPRPRGPLRQRRLLGHRPRRSRRGRTPRSTAPSRQVVHELGRPQEPLLRGVLRPGDLRRALRR